MIIGDLRLPGFEITIYFDHEGNIYGHMGISSTAAPNAGEITTTTVAFLGIKLPSRSSVVEVKEAEITKIMKTCVSV